MHGKAQQKFHLTSKMENKNDSCSSSTKSSVNSITECINEVFFESELETSSIHSINVTKICGNDEEILANDGNNLEQFVSNGASSGIKISKRFRFRKMYLAALAAQIHSFSIGFTLTYTATATEDMNRTSSAVRPTKDQITWIGSLLIIGSIFGTIVASYLSQTIGRKGALIFSTVPFIGGWLLIAYAKKLAHLYSGRIITGFCCGIVCVAGPVYLVEISTPEVRGLLGTSFHLFFVTGELFVSCLGTYIPWTWLAVAGSLISFISLIVTLVVPESPRWLMQRGEVTNTKKALKFLQGENFDVNKECNVIQEDINSQPTAEYNLKEFLLPPVSKSLLYSLLLMFFQQFSGIFAVIFYTVTIFKDAGSSLKPHTATIIIATMQVIANIAGSILVDRVGRKILLFISSVCMTATLAAMGIFDYVTRSNPEVLRKSYGWLPIVVMAIYVIAFAIGLGPIPWIMMPEMTSTRFRSVICSIAIVTNSICAFIVTKTFSNMEALIHDYGTYWTYASSCMIGCFFIYFLLPETKGKTLEEIQQELRRSGILSTNKE